MRRKAQIVITEPDNTATKENDVIGEFLAALGGPGSSANEIPSMVQELQNGEAAVIGSEADEHCAFEGIHSAIDMLCKALDALDIHEDKEKADGSANKGDKKECAAIKKMHKLLEDLKEAENDLHKGEELEHKEQTKVADKEAAKNSKKAEESEVIVVEEEPEIPTISE